MEVILLEKVRNLGGIGEKVSVKAGHARNYLIPYGKAAAATKANLAKFEGMRAELEKNAAAALELAKERATKLETLTTITIPVKATEEGKLFGSVSTGIIAQALETAGFTVEKSEISMPLGSIRQLGEYEVTLLLHTDITVKIKVIIVALSE